MSIRLILCGNGLLVMWVVYWFWWGGGGGYVGDGNLPAVGGTQASGDYGGVAGTIGVIIVEYMLP